MAYLLRLSKLFYFIFVLIHPGFVKLLLNIHIDIL
jgi:hypothetical protein